MRILGENITEQEFPIAKVGGNNDFGGCGESVSRQHEECITYQGGIFSNRFVTGGSRSDLPGGDIAPDKLRFAVFRRGGRNFSHRKVTAFSHILEFYFLDSHLIRYRSYFLECKGNLGQCVVEVYIHTFNPYRARYSRQYIDMIGGGFIRCIIQHHFSGINETRSRRIRITVRIPGEELHARIQQSGPILQRRDGGCQVGVNRSTCIEVWLGNRSIGSQ